MVNAFFCCSDAQCNAAPCKELVKAFGAKLVTKFTDKPVKDGFTLTDIEYTDGNEGSAMYLSNQQNRLVGVSGSEKVTWGLCEDTNAFTVYKATESTTPSVCKCKNPYGSNFPDKCKRFRGIFLDDSATDQGDTTWTVDSKQTRRRTMVGYQRVM